MKRPKSQVPKRPKMANTAVARNPKEAAIGLVRLEFDAARLQMGIDQAKERAETYLQELSRNKAERENLLAILNS